jgi:steroid delta-isomerase-like uncharacterized protein
VKLLINIFSTNQKESAMNFPIRTILKTGSLFLLIALILTGCQQQKPDPSEELKPILEKGVAIWNNGNLDEVGEVWDESVVRIVNQLPDVNGVDGMKKAISDFRTAFPDLELTSEEEIYSDNKATLRWSFTGTNTGPGEMPPTGKSVEIWGITIIHFSNGKVTREIVAYDNQSLMEQMGFTMIPSAINN